MLNHAETADEFRRAFAAGKDQLRGISRGGEAIATFEGVRPIPEPDARAAVSALTKQCRTQMGGVARDSGAR